MVAFLAVAWLVASPPSPNPPLPPDTPLPDDARVRDMLGRDISGSYGDQWTIGGWLVRHGERLYPAYERVLADPRTGPLQAQNLIDILTGVGGDRTRFADPVAARLWFPRPEVRASAVMLLGEIGTDKQAAALVPLLGDATPHRVPYITIRSLAAEAMAKIGGRRELAALDQFVALSESYDKLAGPDRDAIVKARDALRKRLDLPAAPKP
jgi:HEAT repeat protein